MLTVTELVLQLVLEGIQVLPSIISAAQTEISLFKSGAPVTDTQQAQIDLALNQAHAALQAAKPEVI